jgi:hypothetical protein
LNLKNKHHKTRMIKKHSDDPNVQHAAGEALKIITETLSKMPPADSFDYGGHELKIGEYGVCDRCTRPIAEAQAAEQTLRTEMELLDDETIKEHLALAANLFHAEAEAATLRAEFHNGQGTEAILNRILGYQYERRINEDYTHSHSGGQA